jgi:hypothetical protein
LTRMDSDFFIKVLQGNFMCVFSRMRWFQSRETDPIQMYFQER